MLLLGLWVVPVSADFNAGSNAYQKGDFKSAYKLLLPEARQGGPKAQFALGLLFQGGKGVKKDYTQAYKWYSLAEAQGHKIAPKNKAEIAAKMSPEQIQKAEALIKEFQASGGRAPSASLSKSVPDAEKVGTDEQTAVQLPAPAKKQHQLGPEVIKEIMRSPELEQRSEGKGPLFRTTGGLTVLNEVPGAQGTRRLEVAVNAEQRNSVDEEFTPITIHMRVVLDSDGGLVNAYSTHTFNAEDRELGSLLDQLE